MFKNILSDVQKKELELIIDDYKNPVTRNVFWSRFENWIFEFLKSYLSTVFRNSMGNSLKEMQESVSKSDIEKKSETIIH